MATRDRNGALHSEENGQFVSGGGGDGSGFDVEKIEKQTKGHLATVVPGRGEPTGERKANSIYDMNALTFAIESDPRSAARILRQAIVDGKVNTKVHRGHQDKHIVGTQNYKQEIANGREPSILTEDAEMLIKKYAGNGIPMIRDGKWMQTEKFTHFQQIGIYVNKRKNVRYNTNSGRIHYSNKGAHVVPDRKDD